MPNNAPPKVIIIILTCNQKAETLSCLKSLFFIDYELFEIVVVDNGSSDDTISRVQAIYPNIHYIYNNKNLGASRGRNIGLNFARNSFTFDYVLFMDNDMVVTSDFLHILVCALENTENPNVVIATPKIYYLGTDKVFDNAGGARVNFYTGSTQTRGNGETDKGQYDSSTLTNLVPTTMVLMAKKAIERSEGYDIIFDPYGYEDLDMILRSNKKGTPTLFVPSAIVYHKGNRTGFSGYSTEYANLKMRNLKIFLKRHSTKLQRLVFFCLLPLLALRSIIRQVAGGNLASIIGLFKGYFKKNI